MNLGCPLDAICAKGCGAALMQRRGKLEQIARGMVGVLSCPLTIKMRTGWSDGSLLAHKLVPAIQRWYNGAPPPDAPKHAAAAAWSPLPRGSIGAVFVHGCTRLQRYTKSADWGYVRCVAAAQDPELHKLPVIGNGDILSSADWEAHRAAGEVAPCCMLARGALIKPWLPTEVKERRDWDISSSERLELLRDFTRFGLEHWGADAAGVARVRRFLLEWLSFLYRYVPVGVLEVLPQRMNDRPPAFVGRDELETLFASPDAGDWVRITEMLLGKVPEDFEFAPKHKSNAYQADNIAIQG